MKGAAPGRKPRVYVVDDDESVRHSLADILTMWFEVETFASPTALLESLNGTPEVGCIITDVRMPEMNGLELLGILEQQQRNVPVVIITGHGDIPMAVRAMKAGAVDFIEKPYSVDDIVKAVETATKPCPAAGAGASRSTADEEFLTRLETLTPRQRETLDLIVQGHTNTSAAYHLGISPRTVEVHRARIMEKMGASSLADLVRRSIQAQPH